MRRLFERGLSHPAQGRRRRADPVASLAGGRPCTSAVSIAGSGSDASALFFGVARSTKGIIAWWRDSTMRTMPPWWREILVF